MRTAVVLLALLQLPTAVAADSPTKAEKIEDLFRIMKVDQLNKQMFEQMKSGLSGMLDQPNVSAEAKASRDELFDEVFAVVNRRVGWDKLRPTFIQLYSDTFTEAEIDSLLTFYKSPGGAAMLDKLPVLMKKVIEFSQSQMKDAYPEIQATVEKFIEKHKGQPKQN